MDGEGGIEGRLGLRVSLHHHGHYGDAQLDEMGELVREGVPSFKLFMAYPGVFMLDDASIFKAMSRGGEAQRADLHARGKRRRD